MPIRINLKEVFTADSQDIVINKVNFNFNKLLELGIGDDGPQGITGPQGPAGPTGSPGVDGAPGNIWYVDTAADPNTLPLPDANDGDFYLDTNLFTIWRYDGVVWTELVDITQIINDYLSTSGSVFTRGFGNGTSDTNFIVFNNRGQDAIKRLNDSNDILFLNNFNETYLNSIYSGFTLNSSDFFNSLLSISVDRSNITPYRQHIELGVLYGDGMGEPTGHTTTNESLKIKYERIDSSVHGYTNYNISTVSMDLPETVSTGRLTNGIFNFVNPKTFIADGIDTRSNLYIGSRYGLDEVVGTSEQVLADGILFYNVDDSLFANIGIAQDFVIPNFPATTGYIDNSPGQSYFMIDSVNTTITSVYLNDPVYQDGGNIIQVGTTPAREVTTISATYNSPYSYLGHMGIAVSGNNVYTISGWPACDGSQSPYYQSGFLNRFNIENPNTPVSDLSIIGIGVTEVFGFVDYETTTNLIGPGASDITVLGENIYIVNSQPFNYGYTQVPIAYGSDNFVRTNLQVLKIDAGTGVSRYTYFNSPEIYNAYRIKPKGNRLIIASNDLYNGVSSFYSLSDGVVSSVNSDPDNLTVDAFQVNTKDVPTANLISNQRSAYLDLAVVDDFAVTLTWEQEVVTTFPAVVDPYAKVKVDVFNLSEIQAITPSITWIGRSENPFFESQFNTGDYNSIFKKGAVCANRKYFYAGYSNEIKVFQFNEKLDPNTYAEVNSFTLSDITPGSTSGIYDIEQLGNSLYVLAHNTGTPVIYKLDISQVDTGTIEQIWSTELTYASTQLVVIGKHIYAANHSNDSGITNIPALTIIDFDGIYTSGAHIESLRTDTLHVSQNVTIGESLHIDGDVEIGGSVKLNGNIDRLNTSNALKFTDPPVYDGGLMEYLPTARIDSPVGINFYATVDGTGTPITPDNYATLSLDGFKINNSGFIKTEYLSLQGTTIASTVANMYFYTSNGQVTEFGDQGHKMMKKLQSTGVTISGSSAGWLRYDPATGVGNIPLGGAWTNPAAQYDIYIQAFWKNGSGAGYIELSLDGTMISRSSGLNTASGFIPAGSTWELFLQNGPGDAQINWTIYKYGTQSL